MTDFQPGSSAAHWAQSMEEQMESQREQLQARRASQIAENSGAIWNPQDEENEEGTLTLKFLDVSLVVKVPEYTILTAEGDDVPTMTQGLVTSYLLRANGAQRKGEWIKYRELPGGMFYSQAFDGYTGQALTRALGDNLEAFKRGAKASGGRILTGFGDAAYEFNPLPRLWLAMVYWLGDEEDGFPPQASVLFDPSASEYLIIDGLAILASQLTRRIMKMAKT